MTDAQSKYLISLTGGLDAALQACRDAGFEMSSLGGKSAKMRELSLVPTADASEIISELAKPANRQSVRVGSESAEEDGYMVDRGEDN